MPTDPRIGTTLAGYRIIARVGHGGMSVVYLARDPRLDRRVALKLMDAALAEDAPYRERFLREAQAAATLEHPNILPVYAAGETLDGELFIASRYVVGGDLGTLLQGPAPLSRGRVISLIAQVAAALDAAHAAGMVHRDVKPANILVDRLATLDHAYLSDFGLTKRLDSSGLTRIGQMLGTIDYIAPEQIEGRDVDGRADLYSLGCVLFECLTGEPPFANENPVMVIDAQRHTQPPLVTDRRMDLPDAIDAVIAKAMAKQPGERFALAGELADATRSALADAPPAVQAPVGAPASQRPPPPVVTAPSVGSPQPESPPVDAPAPSAPAPPIHDSSGDLTIVSFDEQAAGPERLPVGTGVRADDPSGSHKRTRRNVIGVVGVIFVLAAVVLAVVIASRGGAQQTTHPASGLILPPNLGAPMMATAAGGKIWIAYERGAIVGLRSQGPATIIAAPTPSPGASQANAHVVAMTGAFGELWVADSTGELRRIAPDTGVATDVSVLGRAPLALAAGGDRLWALEPGGVVQVIDVTSGQTDEVDRLSSAAYIAAGRGGAWIANKAGTVWRILNRPPYRIYQRPIPAGPNVIALALGGQYAWIVHANGDITLISIDHNSPRAGPSLNHASAPAGAATTKDALWIIDEDGTLSKIIFPTNPPVSIAHGPDDSSPVAVLVPSGLNVWIVSSDGGISRFDASNQWTTIVPGSGS